MKLKYLRHAAFLLDNDATPIVIDPYLTGGNVPPIDPVTIKPKYIIVTHAHFAHLGNTVELANNKADVTVIAVPELANYLASNYNIIVERMQIGIPKHFAMGNFTVKFTKAVHSRCMIDGTDMGEPVGVVINKSGKTLYHTGDTFLFPEMVQIGIDDKIDIMLAPIGGTYTMDIVQAVLAVGRVKPGIVIPMHFKTFPEIDVNPLDFCERLGSTANCNILQFGDERVYSSKPISDFEAE
jgi:L-ascorbate metabolism protein UlaG (beta-lactamase superfamily)